MTLVDGLAPPSSQAAGVDLGGPCASRLDASARHPPAIAIVGRLCEHYIPNHQRQPHITTVYAFDHTRQITANVCAFRVLLHGVARVTDFQTACSEAAHGNRRMPFCALLPSCRTPPSLLRSTLPRPRRRFRAAHSRVGQPGSAIRNREETLHQDGDDGSHPGSRPIRQSFGDEAAARMTKLQRIRRCN